MTRVIFDVPDISCEHCQQTITRVLSGRPGVQSVRVDIPTKQVTLEVDDGRVNLEQLQQALADEDYPVARVTRL